MKNETTSIIGPKNSNQEQNRPNQPIMIRFLLFYLLISAHGGRRSQDGMPVHFDNATPEQVRNEFNFFGLLNVKNVQLKSGYDCGSTLVAENIVVTAAHCVEHILSNSERTNCEPTELQCIETSFHPGNEWALDVTFRQREKDSRANDIARFNAGRIFVHKDWMKVKYNEKDDGKTQKVKDSIARHDIAVIFLTHVTESLGLSPAPLATAVPNQGEEIKSFGWGLKEKMFLQNMMGSRRPVERSPYDANPLLKYNTHGNQNRPVGRLNNRHDVMEDSHQARVGSLTFNRIWEWIDDDVGFRVSEDNKGEVFTVKPRPRKDRITRNQMIASGDSGGPVLRILEQGKYELLGVISGALAAQNQVDVDVWAPDTSIESGHGHIVSLLPDSPDRKWLDALIHHLEVPTLVQHDEVLEEEQPTRRQRKKKRELVDGDNNIEGGREDKIAKMMPADIYDT